MLRSSVSTPISDHHCLMSAWVLWRTALVEGLVGNAQGRAIQFADAVAVSINDASLVKPGVGAGDVLHQAAVIVGRNVVGRAVDDVAGRLATGAVELAGDECCGQSSLTAPGEWSGC